MTPLLALLTACTPTVDDPAKAEESDSPIETATDTDAEPDCEETFITITGADPPVVGDEWDIFLWCDDALLAGTMLVQFTPPEVARINVNHATFLEPGDALLQVQAGRHRAERTVLIGED